MVEPSKIIFLVYQILYKGRIESYSIMGTIVSPNKILFTSGSGLSAFSPELACCRRAIRALGFRAECRV